MMHLVGIVMAISLAALAIGAGANWISLTALPRREAAILAGAGFDALATAATAYRIANGGLPSVAEGGRIPTDLVPAYVEMPRAPGRMAWSYGIAEDGVAWLCLSGHVSDAQWAGLDAVRRERPHGTVGLVSRQPTDPEQAGPEDMGCGAFGSDGEPTVDVMPDAFPAPAAMTFSLFR